MDSSDTADSKEASELESWFEEERELAKSDAGMDIREEFKRVGPLIGVMVEGDV